MDKSVTFLGGFSQRLVTNTFFNLLGRSWSFLTTLLLTPYILSHLDVGEFGTWIVLSVFMNSFNLLDLGLGASFVKYISEYYTRQDFDRINRVLFSGLIFYGLFGAVIVAGGLIIEKPLFAWFRVGDASDAYFIILLSCAVHNISAMFLSVFRGIQRMDKSNSLEIKLSIINAIGTVLFLRAGLGIYGLALNTLISACMALVLIWWNVRRTLPNISLGWNFDAALLRQMFAYGAKIQVSRLGGLVCFQVDKLIISRFLGIAAVSFYEVSSRLTSFMRAVPLVMISAVIPATSELDARNDRPKILETYLLASKYVALLTIALVAFLVLEARSVLLLWLGPGFEDSVILVQILAIGYGVNVLGGAASQTGAGIGRPEFDMRATVILSVLNPILSLILVRQFQAPGAAAGTTLAMVVSAVYLLVIFHRKYVGESVWQVIVDIYVRKIGAGVITILTVLGFHLAIPQVASWENIRLLVPLKIALDFALFAPIYVALLVALRQVTAIDWKNFVGLVAFGFEFLRHPLRERVKIYR